MSVFSITIIPPRWLPLIRQAFGEYHETPVILVGNKSDGTANNTDKVED